MTDLTRPDLTSPTPAPIATTTTAHEHLANAASELDEYESAGGSPALSSILRSVILAVTP